MWWVGRELSATEVAFVRLDAPRTHCRQNLDFYDCDWQKMGPLRQLTKQTSAATGIDAEYLDDPW